MIPGRLRRMVRLLTVGAVAILALICIAVALVASSSVRNLALDLGFRRANDVLPGTISVGHAAWNRPSAAHVEDLLWIDGQDTLVSIEELDLSLSIGALLRRDLVLTRLFADGIRADIPAVHERVDDLTQGRRSHERHDSKRFFPRPGSLPGLPSMAVRELELHVAYLRLASDASVSELDTHMARSFPVEGEMVPCDLPVAAGIARLDWSEDIRVTKIQHGCLLSCPPSRAFKSLHPCLGSVLLSVSSRVPDAL